MKVAIRTDSSTHIGIGHAMRCLALARALRDLGADVRFICRDRPGSNILPIQKHGFRVELLERRSDDAGAMATLGCALAHDAAETLAVLGRGRADCIVIDHYAIDHAWQELVRPSCSRILVIDDLATRHHDADLLVDPTPGREPAEYTGIVPARTGVLTGAGYAMLAPEFNELRERALARRASAPEMRQLLVFMGGTDAQNLSEQVLDALDGLEVTMESTVVMGATSPSLNRIRLLVKDRWPPTRLVVQTEHMADFIEAADIGIGAGGLGALERCCLGLPSVVIAVSENQQRPSEALAKAGAAMALDASDPLAPQLEQALAKLSEKDVRHQMQSAAAALVDGLGARRVANALMELGA